jgi:hypothetical protein
MLRLLPGRHPGSSRRLGSGGDEPVPSMAGEAAARPVC